VLHTLGQNGDGGAVMSRCVRLIWILLLVALASPRVAHAEWLPGDPPPMPEDVLWQPMRIPSFEPGGLPLGVADYQGKLVMVGGFGAIGRTRTLGAVAWDGVTFERLGTPSSRDARAC
jgi:hypothetical protein